MPTVPLPELAMRWGVSQEAIRKKVARGRLRGYKRGSRWFVEVTDADLQSGQTGQPDNINSESGQRKEPDGLAQLAQLVARLYDEQTALHREIADLRAQLAEAQTTLKYRAPLLLPPPTWAEGPSQPPGNGHVQPSGQDMSQPAPAKVEPSQLSGQPDPAPGGRRRWWHRLLWG